MQSIGCDLVPAVSDHQQPRPDHLWTGLQGANRLIAAGLIEPVIAHDKVLVGELDVALCAWRGMAFPSSLNADAVKVLSRRATPKPSSNDPAFGASYRFLLGFECRKSVIGMVRPARCGLDPLPAFGAVFCAGTIPIRLVG